MIRLERSLQAPECIAGDTGAALLEEFKATKKPVWRIEALKEALLETTHGECAYCETPLGEGAAYIEVEHFRHKDVYGDFAITWSNLLPSCRRCNAKKGAHDVVQYPIINPYETNPRDHFKFECFRLAPMTELGKETVEVLDLNDTQRLGMVRWKLSERLKKAVNTCHVVLERYKLDRRVRSRNSLIEKLEDILLECQPTSSYSASAATILHSDSAYYQLIRQIKLLGDWTDELELMHARSRGIAFEVQGLVVP